MEQFPLFEEGIKEPLSKKEERIEGKIRELEKSLPKGESLLFIDKKHVFLVFSALYHEEFYLKSKLNSEEIKEIHVSGKDVEEYLLKRGVKIKSDDREYLDKGSYFSGKVSSDNSRGSVSRLPVRYNDIPTKDFKKLAANDAED